MKPRFARAAFGSILVDERPCDHDVYVRLNGKVKKRRKRLSRRVFGGSHVVSIEEARHVYQRGAKRLIVGAGYDGVLTLSPEASAYLKKHGCRVDMRSTPDAADLWNEARGPVIGLFHVTC